MLTGQILYNSGVPEVGAFMDRRLIKLPGGWPTLPNRGHN